MTHDYWEHLLLDYEEGALDPKTRALLEEHIEGCSDCQALLSFSAERAALRLWYEETPTILVDEAVAARIVKHEDRSLPWRVLRSLARRAPIPTSVKRRVASVAFAIVVTMLLLFLALILGGATPNEDVLQAYENLQSLTTLRYTMVEERLECVPLPVSGSSEQPLETDCRVIQFYTEGEIVFPDSWRERKREGDENASGAVYREQLVIDGVLYSRIDSQWVKQEGIVLVPPVRRFFPANALDVLRTANVMFEELPEEEIAGVLTKPYRGKWQHDSTTVLMEIWIEKATGIPRKIHHRTEAPIEEDPQVGTIDGFPIVRLTTRWIAQTYNFFDFNAPITLEKPDLDR